MYRGKRTRIVSLWLHVTDENLLCAVVLWARGDLLISWDFLFLLFMVAVVIRIADWVILLFSVRERWLGVHVYLTNSCSGTLHVMGCGNHGNQLFPAYKHACAPHNPAFRRIMFRGCQEFNTFVIWPCTKPKSVECSYMSTANAIMVVVQLTFFKILKFHGVSDESVWFICIFIRHCKHTYASYHRHNYDVSWTASSAKMKTTRLVNGIHNSTLIPLQYTSLLYYFFNKKWPTNLANFALRKLLSTLNPASFPGHHSLKVSRCRFSYPFWSRSVQCITLPKRSWQKNKQMKEDQTEINMSNWHCLPFFHDWHTIKTNTEAKWTSLESIKLAND